MAARSVAARQAVADAYVVHYRAVYRYALTLTRSKEAAEDVAAEAFERALETWDVPPASELRWLLVVARRLATDRWRRARRLAQKMVTSAAKPTQDAAHTRTEFWLWFESVSTILTDRQREVLTLRYQRDLTDADIAAVMGLSESGVRSLVARAVAILRTHPEVL
jgi:RNA polymerase sigma-70 factor, ECF subfamily